MTVKRIIVLCILAILASCQKQSDIPVGPVTDKVYMTINVNQKTKADVADETSEAYVNKLEALVFNDGKLNGYGINDNISSQDSLYIQNVACTKGERTLYVVANSDVALDKMETEEEFLSSFSSLKNNILGKELKNFVMLGKKEVTLNDYTLVSLKVDRIASRVFVHKLTNSLKGAMAYSSFEVVRTYMTNVVNRYSFDGAFVPDTLETNWYNRMMYQSDSTVSQKDPFILRTGVACALSAGQSIDYTVNEAMYVYPNPVQFKTASGEWSPRISRLVFEIKIAGVLYYYPVNMPIIKSNKSYEIDEIIITRPGSKDPDVPVADSQATFEVKVLDWNEVLAGNKGVVEI